MPAISSLKDPLKYWKNHENEFPILYKIAKKVLTISGSSVSVGRVFSISGYTVQARRNKL